MLSAYHERFISLTDEEIAHRLMVKERQLRQTFVAVGLPSFPSPTLKVAVLGCADRRMVVPHRQMFETLFGKPVELTTFDVTIEHLKGETGVVEHDATEPLPGAPFDLVYADVLARFIDPAKQYLMLKNAYDALGPGGVAIITFDKNDYDPKPDYVPIPGTSPVDFNALQFELTRDHIQYLEVPTRVETAPPGQDDKILIEDMVLMLRKP